jgi:hypothetical protein
MNSEDRQYKSTGYWKCSKCGIVHTHNPNHEKHNIQGSVRNSLTFNKRCHCGIHEAYELHLQNKLDADDWVIECFESNKQERLGIPESTRNQIYS